MQVILSALCPLFCNSMRPQYTLQMFTDHFGPRQTIPCYEKPLIRDCCNRKGSCTQFLSYLTIAAGISSSSFVWVSTKQLAVSSLSKGISSTLKFHESIGTDGTPCMYVVGVECGHKLLWWRTADVSSNQKLWKKTQLAVPCIQWSKIQCKFYCS